MTLVLEVLALGSAALIASTLAAVAGFGGAAVLLPILSSYFGVRDAIPILTVAQLIGNGSRVWFNRREVDFRLIAWFSLGSIPTAYVGGLYLSRAPLLLLTRLLGAFLLLVVVWKAIGPSRIKVTLKRPHFAVIGAILSFLSALLGSVGPVLAPFFLTFGLVKGAYIGTEAMATVTMHVFKLVAYRDSGLVDLQKFGMGCAIGGLMICGSYLGKRILDRTSGRFFIWIIEAVLLLSGLNFLFAKD